MNDTYFVEVLWMGAVLSIVKVWPPLLALPLAHQMCLHCSPSQLLFDAAQNGCASGSRQPDDLLQ